MPLNPKFIRDDSGAVIAVELPAAEYLRLLERAGEKAPFPSDGKKQTLTPASATPAHPVAGSSGAPEGRPRRIIGPASIKDIIGSRNRMPVSRGEASTAWTGPYPKRHNVFAGETGLNELSGDRYLNRHRRQKSKHKKRHH